MHSWISLFSVHVCFVLFQLQSFGCHIKHLWYSFSHCKSKLVETMEGALNESENLLFHSDTLLMFAHLCHTGYFPRWKLLTTLLMLYSYTSAQHSPDDQMGNTVNTCCMSGWWWSGKFLTEEPAALEHVSQPYLSIHSTVQCSVFHILTCDRSSVFLQQLTFWLMSNSQH